MSLDESNGLLYFNSADCIYSYDVTTNTMEEFALVDTTLGNCYGLRVEDSIVYAAVSSNPNVENTMQYSGKCIENTLVTMPVVLKGDVNGDGIINIVDVTEIQKQAAGKGNLTAEQLVIADYNDDGLVNVLDATEIQKTMVGF